MVNKRKRINKNKRVSESELQIKTLIILFFIIEFNSKYVHIDLVLKYCCLNSYNAVLYIFLDILHNSVNKFFSDLLAL